MKSILLTLLCIVSFRGVIDAQTTYCYIHSETCPDDFPPDADVVIEGESISFRTTDILEHDADWYSYDGSTSEWSTLKDTQIHVFASGTFDEEFDVGEWEAYLEDVETAFLFAADGDIILVLDKSTLHLVYIPASYVLSVPYTEGVHVPSCTTPDGDRIYWAGRSEFEGFRIVRCYRRFNFGWPHARLRIIEDPKRFKAGTLNILNATSPFDHAKLQYSVDYYLNPPAIWFNEIGKYGALFQVYILLDGTYADDLDNGKLGPQKFWSISLHDRLVSMNLGTVEYRELGDVNELKRQARSALLNIFERALLSAPAKWLLWVETGDDNILIRNLSTMYTKEEKQ